MPLFLHLLLFALEKSMGVQTIGGLKPMSKNLITGSPEHVFPYLSPF
jgi:hypothetical protein